MSATGLSNIAAFEDSRTKAGGQSQHFSGTHWDTEGWVSRRI